jgi:transitional endoplasmic reticulum ATPase
MEPGESERLSIPPPTGLILVGAPGTGKTMTARLIASQVRRSFYAITPGEVLSGQVGGSVKRLKEVFARAKENAPSVLFFDEMDGLFPAPSIATGQHDIQLVEQGLIEISQLRPEHNVFLIGTSNYLERIDPRVLRGGRFSEKLDIGLPDDAGYRKLIPRYLGNARLDPNLDIGMVIDRVRDLTPADLEATIQGMKRSAMRPMTGQQAGLPPLTIEDLEHALSRVRPPV